MKRVGFCDAYLFCQQLKEKGLRDILRMENNEYIIEGLRETADILRYPFFNVHRIRKDQPIEGIITSLYEKGQEGDRFIQSGAKLEDIETIHNEFPNMKILVYTFRDDALDYRNLSTRGINDIVWRDQNTLQDSIELLVDWVNKLEELK